MSDEDRGHEDAHEAYVDGESEVADEVVERVAEGAEPQEVPVEEEPTEAEE